MGALASCKSIEVPIKRKVLDAPMTKSQHALHAKLGATATMDPSTFSLTNRNFIAYTGDVYINGPN